MWNRSTGCPIDAFSLVICRDPRTCKWLCVEAPENKGWWVPGGFVDLGQNHHTAAILQTKAETGVDVVLKGVLRVESILNQSDKFGRQRVFYYAEPSSSTTTSTTGGAAWKTHGELKELFENQQLYGRELLDWSFYMENGGTLYPFNVLVMSESEPIIIPPIITTPTAKQLTCKPNVRVDIKDGGPSPSLRRTLRAAKKFSGQQRPLHSHLHAFSLVICRHVVSQKWLAVEENKNRGWWLPGGFVDPGGDNHESTAIRETLEEAGMDVVLKGVLRIESSRKMYGGRQRVIYYAEPLDIHQIPKQIPDEESLSAAWMTTMDMSAQFDRGELRGTELLDWASYIEAGGTIYPLSVLVMSEEEEIPVLSSATTTS